MLDISVLGLTPTAVNAMLVTVILSLFFVIAGVKIKKADPSEPPRGFVLVMELLFTGVTHFTKEQVGVAGSKYVPFIMTVGAYLLLANLLGLFGFRPPTIDINVTVALSLMTLIYIMVSGVFAQGFGGYLKAVFVGPASSAPPVIKQFIILINVISELTKLISLSFRLFGNIVSGTLLVVLFSMLPLWTSPALPLLNAYFDVFAGLMQTMVFCILMMMWLKTATVRE